MTRNPSAYLIALMLMAIFSGCSTGTPFFQAVRTGDVISFIEMTERDPDIIHSRNNDGDTPLHWLAKHLTERDVSGKISISISGKGTETEGGRLLLFLSLAKEPSLINARNNMGDTPLHSACRRRNRVGAILLIQAGADIDMRNARGLRPADLYVAGRGGKREADSVHAIFRQASEKADKNILLRK